MTPIEFALTLLILTGLVELKEWRLSAQNRKLRAKLTELEKVLEPIAAMGPKLDRVLADSAAGMETIRLVKVKVEALESNYEIRLRRQDNEAAPDFII